MFASGLEEIKNRLTDEEKSRLSRSRQLGRFCWTSIRWFVLLFFAVITAFPLIWTILSSFKTSQEILSSALALPTKLHWENYINALKVTGIARAFLNSLVVTGVSVIINAYIAILAAYVMARFRFRGSGFLMFLLTMGILIPINSALLPIKLVMDRLYLSNSLFGLAVLYATIGLPISVLILRSYILGIPIEIDEAARIDGAGLWYVVRGIITPIARPGLVTIMILQAIYCWNEFLFAIVLISSEVNRTLQIAIRFFVGRFFFDYGGLFAAMVLAILPTVVLFVMFQEHVVSSLSAGAVKH
ncbi:MAG: carbohydrate ABC transporter permease [Bacillota bacterium]